MALVAKFLGAVTITATAGGGTAQTVYTNPLGVKTVITHATVTNLDSVPRAFTFSRVPVSGGNAGTEASGNRIASNLIVPAGGAAREKDKIVLESENDTIQVFAEASGIFNVHLMGTQET